MIALQRIKDKEIKIGVIGLGYVGLPLAVEFALVGFDVLGFEVSDEKVELIGKGISYIQDVKTEDVKELTDKGLLKATLDFTKLVECDAVLICVPTPLSKTKDPDVSFINDATSQIVNNFKKGQLIVLESTTYPGTTEEIIQAELEKKGYKAGEDFFLAFSPERVDPGNPVYQTKNTPKVIGGVTPKCSELAKALYEIALDHIVTVSSPAAAEMVKLLENTFRSVNIGLVNEMSIVCKKIGIDIWEVIDAAKTKPFGFMAFYPGPGLGGHCIPIDPLYLSWRMKAYDYNARFIELASEINTNMPYHVISLIYEALNSKQKSINGSKMLVLGVAYKRDIDDLRESPALDIIKLLLSKGANVEFYDTYIDKARINGEMMHSVKKEELKIEDYDCVVCTTDHSNIDYKEFISKAKVFVDTRNVSKGIEADNVFKL